MQFYEVQQYVGSSWTKVGFFRKQAAAKEYIKEFNTKVFIAPLKIIEREFLDDKSE